VAIWDIRGDVGVVCVCVGECALVHKCGHVEVYVYFLLCVCVCVSVCGHVEMDLYVCVWLCVSV